MKLKMKKLNYEKQIEENNKLIQKYKDLGDTTQLAILEKQNQDLLEENLQIKNIENIESIINNAKVTETKTKSNYFKYSILVFIFVVGIALFVKYKK